MRFVKATIWILCFLLILSSATLCSNAHAQDRWTGEDKVQHAVYSCTAGVAATAIVGPEHPWWAFGLGLFPGVRKEWYDQKHKAQYGNGWSWKDMTANAIGDGFCVGVTRWAFKRGQDGKTQITLSWALE